MLKVSDLIETTNTGLTRLVDGLQCAIYAHGEDFFARNPSGLGMNWVSSGSKFKKVLFENDHELEEARKKINDGYHLVSGEWKKLEE